MAGYRLPGTGTGFAYEWRAATYAALAAKVAGRVEAWNQRLARYDGLLIEYAGLPLATSEEDRLQFLRTAETLISTGVTGGLDSANHLGALTQKRTDFVAKRDVLQQRVDGARPTLAQLVADVEAALPLDLFDHDAFTVDAEQAEIARFRADLAKRVETLAAEVTRRQTAADSALTDHDAAPDSARAEILQNGAKALLGDDVMLVPQITLPAAASSALNDAVAHSNSGALTRHLTDAPPAGSGRDFPVDDWLHGVARVREKMHHWENVVLLADALPGATPPELTPVQLPHHPGAAVAGARDSRDGGHRRRPSALHGCLRRTVRPD